MRYIINSKKLQRRRLSPFLKALELALATNRPDLLSDYYDENTAASLMYQIDQYAPRLWKSSKQHRLDVLEHLKVISRVETIAPDTTRITVTEDTTKPEGLDIDNRTYNLDRSPDGARAFRTFATQHREHQFFGQLTHRMHELLKNLPPNCHLTNGRAPPPFVRSG